MTDEETEVSKRLRHLETEVQLLKAKEVEMERDLQFIQTGFGRVMWIIGGGLISAVVAWIAGGGLVK